jgi:hypothetical protein
MKLLTEDAVLVCDHQLGIVQNQTSQSIVTINGRKVLVENDPEGRTIKGCPNIGLTIKPCNTTLKVQQGYSDMTRIDGKRVCLDTVTGLTDGTPPGAVNYKVRTPGQALVDQAQS